MNVDELIRIARGLPEEMKNKPGRILYSDKKTLEGSDVYLIGLNPGGSTNGKILKEEIEAIKQRTKNAYEDEPWEWHGKDLKEGTSPPQIRVKHLVTAIGVEICKVCASNLIFTQTKAQLGLDKPENLAENCWSVHEAIINMAKPKVIIAIGNGQKFSAYTFLKRKLKPSMDTCQKRQVGGKRESCYWYRTDSNLMVVGVPHLSRFTIQDKDGKPFAGVSDLFIAVRLHLSGAR